LKRKILTRSTIADSVNIKHKGQETNSKLPFKSFTPKLKSLPPKPKESDSKVAIGKKRQTTIATIAKNKKSVCLR
jgi:hypothetical protein